MKRTRESKLRRCRSRSRLQFEQLEQRSLLAVASFYFDFYEDVDGVRGEQITGDTVESGKSFFVEIRAREHDPRFSGLADISLDVAWDAPLLQVVEPFDAREAVTANLPVLVRGTLHQEGRAILPFLLDNEVRQDIGHIDGLGGSSLASLGAGHPIGSDGNDRFVKETMRGLSTTDDHFAWLHFEAEQPGESVFTMRQGRLRISPLPVASLTDAQLQFETKTLTIVAPSETNNVENSHQPVDAVVVELSAPPMNSSAINTGPPTALPVVATPLIEVNTLGGQIQFTTALGSGGTSPLVRPAIPDTSKFIEVSNPGTAPLTIAEVRANVPDVTVAGGGQAIVVQPGETKRLGLQYAPRTPSATDAAVGSFDIADGIVIFSDAVNAPTVEIGLRGDSTFDADTNYDGRVDLGDLISFDQHFGLQAGDDGYTPQIDPNGDGVIDVVDLRSFAASFHRSREVALIGPVPLVLPSAAEGEGPANGSSSANACFVAPTPRANVASTPHPVSRSVSQTQVRPASFVGPRLPHQQATQLLFAERTNLLASDFELADDLVTVLASDLNSQFGALTP